MGSSTIDTTLKICLCRKEVQKLKQPQNGLDWNWHMPQQNAILYFSCAKSRESKGIWRYVWLLGLHPDLQGLFLKDLQGIGVARSGMAQASHRRICARAQVEATTHIRYKAAGQQLPGTVRQHQTKRNKHVGAFISKAISYILLIYIIYI